MIDKPPVRKGRNDLTCDNIYLDLSLDLISCMFPDRMMVEAPATAIFSIFYSVFCTGGPPMTPLELLSHP